MATRVVHSNSSTSRTTTTSATFSDKVALTFTPDASSTYALMWSAVLDNNSITLEGWVRLRHDTAAVTLGETLVRTKDLTDVMSVGGVAYATFGGSPASQTFSIEFAAESANTVGLQDAYLIAIKLTANDKFATAAATSTTSTDPQLVATLSWTPDAAGDYVILGSAGIGSGTGNRAVVHLFDGTTAYGLCEPLNHQADSSARQPWVHSVYASGLSGAQNWSVRFEATVAATINITDSWLVALRVSDWPAVYQVADRVRSEVESTTPTDRSVLTQTTEEGDHIQIAVGVIDRDATTTSASWRLTRDAATVGAESLIEQAHSTAESPAYRALISSLSAASHTWKTQWYGETATAATALTDSAILVLQIEEASGGVEATPALGSVEITGLAPTVSADAAATPSAGALALTGQAPAVAAHHSASPAAGTVEIVGFAPMVSADAATSLGLGSIELTSFAPILAAGSEVQPSTASVGIDGFAPTIDVGAIGTVEIGAIEWLVSYESTGNVAVSPSAGTVALTGQVPTVSADAASEPQAGAVVIIGLEPAVEVAGNVTALPDSGSLSIAGVAPAVAASVTAELGSGSLELAGQAPDVAASHTAEPAQAALVATGLAPEASATASVEVSAGAVVITGFAPEVTTTAAGEFLPGTGSLALVGASPSLAAASLVEPAAGQAVVAGLVPVISASATAEPADGHLDATGLTPAVSANAETTPDAGAVEIVGHEATIAAAVTAEASVGSIQVIGFAPTVTATVAGEAAPLTGTITITGLIPTIANDRQIDTSPGSVVITGYAPAVAGGTGVVLTAQTGSLVVVGHVPAFAAHFTAAANDAALVLASFAPAVVSDHFIEVSAGTLAVEGFAPLIIRIPPADRRVIDVHGRQNEFDVRSRQLLPAGARDRQFAVSGRRRGFKVGPRGGPSAA